VIYANKKKDIRNEVKSSYRSVMVYITINSTEWSGSFCLRLTHNMYIHFRGPARQKKPSSPPQIIFWKQNKKRRIVGLWHKVCYLLLNMVVLLSSEGLVLCENCGHLHFPQLRVKRPRRREFITFEYTKIRRQPWVRLNRSSFYRLSRLKIA